MTKEQGRGLTCLWTEPDEHVQKSAGKLREIDERVVLYGVHLFLCFLAFLYICSSGSIHKHDPTCSSSPTHWGTDVNVVLSQNHWLS